MDLLVEALRIGLIEDFRIEPFRVDDKSLITGLSITMKADCNEETFKLRQVITNLEIITARFDLFRYRICRMLQQFAYTKGIQYPRSLAELEVKRK